MESDLLRRRLLGGAAWATAGKLLLFPAGLGISAVVVRLLEPAEVGVYFLALNAAVVGAMLVNVGMDGVVLQQLPARLAAEDTGGARGVVRRSGAVVLVVGGLTAAGYALFGHEFVFSPLVGTSSVTVLGLPVAAWILGQALQRWIGQVFRGLHRIAESVALGGLSQFGGVLASGLVFLVLGGTLLVQRQVSLRMALILTAASVVAASAVGLARLLTTGWLSRGSAAGLGRTALILSGAPLLVNGLTEYLSRRTDVWVLGALVTDELTGLYLTVASLTVLVNAPLTVVNLSLAPVIGDLHARGEQEELGRAVGTSVGFALLPALALVLVFVVAGEGLLGVLFGDFYRAGYAILVVLSVGQIVSVMVGSSGYLLLMSGHQVDLMLCSVFGAIVAVVGCVVGGIAAGVPGIAVGSATGTATQQISKLLMARRRTGIWAHARPAAAIATLWRHWRKGGNSREA